MKKILITGSSSYVGTNLKKWLENYPDKYYVDSISLKNDKWKEKDFSSYDVIYHVAGIAHMKESKDNALLYYQVNRDLAYETAKKAKVEGVRHFVFLSSMSVYGIENGVIRPNTIPNPKSNYGKSKLQAENLIKTLEDENFKVAIIRPPMIYGYGCKGNYPKLAKLTLKVSFFPEINNKRSMIYIDNLSEFIRQLIEAEEGGLFFPQNEEYVCTSKMVKTIAEVHKKNVWMTKIFNLVLKVLRITVIQKVFGTLIYEKGMSSYKNNDYCVRNFRDSVIETESREL